VITRAVEVTQSLITKRQIEMVQVRDRGSGIGDQGSGVLGSGFGVLGSRLTPSCMPGSRPARTIPSSRFGGPCVELRINDDSRTLNFRTLNIRTLNPGSLIPDP
jgi:hypothetical protein